MRVLVTGASGFIGAHLVSDLAHRGFEITAVSGQNRPCERVYRAAKSVCALDLEQPGALREVLRGADYRGVIHCAALSRAPLCEEVPARAHALNARVPELIAQTLEKLHAPVELLSLSTDLVFDGGDAPPGGFSEEDAPIPASVYGKTKRLGEEAVLRYERGTVFRLSLVYGGRIGEHHGFLGWIFDGVRKRTPVPLFVDEFRTPILVHDLSEVCARFLASNTPPRGVLHVGGPERLNRHEFGLRLGEIYGFEAEALAPTSRLENAPSPVLRPADVSLSIARLREVLGYTPHGVKSGVRAMREREGEQ